MTIEDLAKQYLSHPGNHPDKLNIEMNEQLKRRYEEEVRRLVGFVEYLEKEGKIEVL